MENELAREPTSKRYFGRDLTNVEEMPAYTAVMEEEKATFSALENLKRTRPQRNVYKPLTNKVPAFSAKTLNGATLAQNKCPEPRYPDNQSRKERSRKRGSFVGTESQSSPSDFNDGVEMMDELVPEKNCKVMDEYKPQYPHPETFQQNNLTYNSSYGHQNGPMKTRYSRPYLMENPRESQEWELPGGNFKDKNGLPLRYIWNHLISTKVAKYQRDQERVLE